MHSPGSLTIIFVYETSNIQRKTLFFSGRVFFNYEKLRRTPQRKLCYDVCSRSRERDIIHAMRNFVFDRHSPATEGALLPGVKEARLTSKGLQTARASQDARSEGGQLDLHSVVSLQPVYVMVQVLLLSR